MATVQGTKPLSSRTVETMKPGDKIKADTGENIGLRVKCGATGVKIFFYRYTSPITSKLGQVKIGNFPATSLAEARLKLHPLLFNNHFRNHFRIDFQLLRLLQG